MEIQIVKHLKIESGVEIIPMTLGIFLTILQQTFDRTLFFIFQKLFSKSHHSTTIAIHMICFAPNIVGLII